MSSLLRVLPCALLTGVLLASSAEARFGKRSGSSEEQEESSSRTHDATPVREDSGSSGGPTHDASPVSSPRPRPSYDGPYDGPEPSVSHGVSRSSHSSWSESRFASRRHRNFTLGIEAQAMREGSGVGLHLGLEGERFGGFLRTSGLSLRAEDGRGATDEISVTELHLSMAVLKGPVGRVRVEGGVSIAKAPDVTFVGPSVGLSSEVYLLSSLALEGRVQLTPWPYRQLDAAAGVAWYFGGWRLFALRGGMRVLMLNDAGRVDGVVHEDVLPGPYLSLGLAI